MGYNAKVFRIMVGGPSDVEREVSVVRDAIELWNGLHSLRQGIVLRMTHWSTDASPGMEAPQSRINRQVADTSDALIAIFNMRLGSPTPDAESGTVEEIQRMADAGKPVQIYFSTAPVERSQRKSEQLEALERFQHQLRSKALYETFTDPDDLRRKLERHLTSLSDDLNTGTSRDEDAARVDFAAPFSRLVRRHQLNWESHRASSQIHLDEPKRDLASFRGDLINLLAQVDLDEFPRFRRASNEVLAEIQDLARFHQHGDNHRHFWAIGNGISKRAEALVAALNSPDGPESVTLPPSVAPRFAHKACLKFDRRGMTASSSGQVKIETIFTNEGQGTAHIDRVSVFRDGQPLRVENFTKVLPSGEPGVVTYVAPWQILVYQNGDVAPADEVHELVFQFSDGVGGDTAAFALHMTEGHQNRSIVLSAIRERCRRSSLCGYLDSGADPTSVIEERQRIWTAFVQAYRHNPSTIDVIRGRDVFIVDHQELGGEYSEEWWAHIQALSTEGRLDVRKEGDSHWTIGVPSTVLSDESWGAQ